MKKVFPFLIFTFLLLTPLASKADSIIFNRPLHVGSSGADVSALQQFLQNKGYFTYPTVTGYYGAFTFKAVAAYQAANSLEQVGSVGPLTRALLNTSLSSVPSSTNTAPATGSTATSTYIQPPFPPTLPGFVPGQLIFIGSPAPATPAPTPAPVVDITPPVISAISAGTPSAGSTTITWTTDEAATSQIIFGTSTTYGSTTLLDTNTVTSHSVVLTGLVAGTAYHYKVASVDASGNAATSTDQTFTSAVLALNSRAVFLGDSITAGSVGPSFTNWSVLYSGGRYYEPPTANQGVGGNSTGQMLARITSSTALLPKVLVVMGGTNDITDGVDTAISTESNLRTIYNDAEAAGSQVLAVTITPRNDTTWTSNAVTNEAYRNAVNTWIKSQTDIKVVDMDAAGFDPASMTIEGLHPNRVGAIFIGQQVGPALAALADPSSILYATPSDFNNILTNNDLAGTAGTLGTTTVTGQVATGWQITSNASGCTAVGSKGTSGGFNQQIITISGTCTSAGSFFFKKTVTYSGAIGDVYDFWANIGVSGLSGNVKGLFMSSDGTALWELNPGDILVNNISGNARGFGSALLTTRTTSTIQFGIYVGVGAVNATLTIQQPTWRKVPAGQ